MADLVVWQNDGGPQHRFTANSPGFSTDGSDVVVIWLGGQHPPILFFREVATPDPINRSEGRQAVPQSIDNWAFRREINRIVGHLGG